MTEDLCIRPRAGGIGYGVRDWLAIAGLVVIAYAVQFVANMLQPSPDYFWITDSPTY